MGRDWPVMSPNRPSSSHYSHVKALRSDVVQSSEVFPSTDLEARLPQSADHIQQRTRTPGGPPRRVFHQALVFFPVLVTAANRSLPQQRLCARGDLGGSTQYIREQQTQKKRIVGQDTSVCFP